MLNKSSDSTVDTCSLIIWIELELINKNNAYLEGCLLFFEIKLLGTSLVNTFSPLF